MNIPYKKANEKYSYADYLNWPDEERWEIIDGRPYMMSPAPSRQHQEILGALYLSLASFLKGKPCHIYPSPFDVRLPLENENIEEISNVVQPDIVVVCDRKKLDDRGCIGAPDLVVEIISPATAKKDLSEKFNLYEKSGIKQYWIVFPKFKVIDIYSLNESGQYEKTASFSAGEKFNTGLFPDLSIDMEEIFID